MIVAIQSEGHSVLGVDLSEVLIIVADPNEFERTSGKPLSFRVTIMLKAGHCQYVTLSSEALEDLMRKFEENQ